jgi:hypothetical protein
MVLTYRSVRALCCPADWIHEWLVTVHTPSYDVFDDDPTTYHVWQAQWVLCAKLNVWNTCIKNKVRPWSCLLEGAIGQGTCFWTPTEACATYIFVSFKESASETSIPVKPRPWNNRTGSLTCLPLLKFKQNWYSTSLSQIYMSKL